MPSTANFCAVFRLLLIMISSGISAFDAVLSGLMRSLRTAKRESCRHYGYTVFCNRYCRFIIFADKSINTRVIVCRRVVR